MLFQHLSPLWQKNNMVNISQKKPYHPVSTLLKEYLVENKRLSRLPVYYEDLLSWQDSVPLLTPDRQDTLWETVLFDPLQQQELDAGLTRVYSLLKAGGDMSVMQHLYVDRIDFCTFGNTRPFRVRIVNRFNDNYDYYYLKRSDASRIYGLELEHVLSPNRIHYLVDKETLIEEHILGIPGDGFIRDHLYRPNINRVRLAKQFVKFNEGCFVRLLGDMRSYNYVIDITQDFDGEEYRIRAIDFDQQCYEGKKNVYLPQSFPENEPVVSFCQETMTGETIRQYQHEERSLITWRITSDQEKIAGLISALQTEQISTPEKVDQLKEEMAVHYGIDAFKDSTCMGDILKTHLQLVLISQNAEPSLLDL